MNTEPNQMTTTTLTTRLVSHLLAMLLAIFVYSLMAAIPMSAHGTDAMLSRFGVEPIGYWEATCSMASLLFLLKSFWWVGSGKSGGSK
jgi:uncharacterized membrane protein